MLRVYYTELPENLRLDEEGLLLSAYRKGKLSGRTPPRARRQMLAAELLLQQAVRALEPELRFPLDIRTGERGKPYFPSLPYAFSLSHSGPFAACAIADRELGLDVQKRSAVREPLLRRCFSEEERRFVDGSADREAAFTELWCLKESYLKATGEGILRPMSGFSLTLGDGPLSLAGAENVRFWRFGDARFSLAVCTLDGREPVPDLVEKAELR